MEHHQDLNFNVAISTQKRTDQNASSAVQNQQQVNVNIEHPIEEKKEEIGIMNFYKKAANPIVCLLTVGFKIAAIVSFILLDLFTDSETIVYLIVILIGAIDFWMTKNISGRKLVGLRWWNEVKENGEEVWIYESKNEKLEHGADRTVFWTSVYGNAGCWVILFVLELIRLKFVWAIIAFILLIFSGTNLYGYFKCSKNQQDNAWKFGKKLVVKVAEKGMEKGIEAAKQ